MGRKPQEPSPRKRRPSRNTALNEAKQERLDSNKAQVISEETTEEVGEIVEEATSLFNSDSVISNPQPTIPPSIRKRKIRSAILDNNTQPNTLSKEEIQAKIDENKDYQINEAPENNILEKYRKQGIFSLSDASEKRNLEALKFFLIHVENIQYCTPLEEWFRALYEAVKNRYTEIIDYLLDNDKEGGLIFHKRTSYSHSYFSNLYYGYQYLEECYPCELHIASKMGYTDIVKKLVEHNKVCEEEYNKSTSIRRSFISNHIREEEYINLEDRKGNTALLYAIQNNHIDIVNYLIQKGSKLTVSIHEEKLESYEHEDYNYEYCSNYTETRYYDAHYYYTVSLLFKAYGYISSSMLALLIENGLDINDNGYKDKTVLDKAYEDNNTEIIKLLINHGAVLSLKENNTKVIQKQCNNYQEHKSIYDSEYYNSGLDIDQQDQKFWEDIL
ncbi:MAG: ankyrin repeat domain-containing protein [Prevotella sp.]|jgi:ankyrin repeat protein|nr:ankyrin repeat domain-containing protein [Prevotella sp.]